MRRTVSLLAVLMALYDSAPSPTVLSVSCGPARLASAVGASRGRRVQQVSLRLRSSTGLVITCLAVALLSGLVAPSPARAAIGTTTVMLDPSAWVTKYGDPVTISVRVEGGGGHVDRGTVEFVDNYRVIATVDVDPATGMASVTKSDWAVGQHSLYAMYNDPTGVYVPSGSSTTSFRVFEILTTTAVSSATNPATDTDSITLTAAVTPNPGQGRVVFSSGMWTTNYAASVDPVTGTASLTLPSVKVGTWDITANFRGIEFTFAPSAAVISQVIRKATSTTLTSSPNPAISGQDNLVLRAQVIAANASPSGGQVSFFERASGSVVLLGTATLKITGGESSATYTTNAMKPGAHELFAEYGGTDMYAPSTSDSLDQEVVPDTGVAVSGVRVRYSTFYPYRDGYRDSVAISGNLLEPGTATITIRNSSGTRVASKTLGPTSGGFSWVWNGRTSSGSMRAAGTYSIKVRVHDLAGNAQSFSLSVVLSHKRLYYYSGSKTKNGDAFSGYAFTPYAWVSPDYSRYDHGVDLFGNSGSQYASVRYTFSIPAAAVYKKITFSALGRQRGSGGPATLELWNYRTKDYDPQKLTGLTYGWYSVSASGTDRVSARTVRGYVTAYGYNNAHWDVAKVKLTYTYGVLK